MTTKSAKAPTEIALPSGGGDAGLRMIETAISNKADPAVLERLVALKERLDKSKAEEEFGRAIAAFQAKCPKVEKTRMAQIEGRSGGKWGYKYASYEDVDAVVRPIMSEFGISASFTTSPDGSGIKTSCRIRVGTHYEDHNMTVPIPQGVMNDVQKFGAAVSYAKRYVLCAALNIVVGDEDDDAASAVETIHPDQIEVINDLIEKAAPRWNATASQTLKRFLAWAGVESLDRLPVNKFAEAQRMLSNGGGR